MKFILLRFEKIFDIKKIKIYFVIIEATKIEDQIGPPKIIAVKLT